MRARLPLTAALLLVLVSALPGKDVVLQKVIVVGKQAAPGPAAPPRSDEELLREAKVGLDGPALLAFFRERVVGAADEDRIKGLIARLGDDVFERREEASGELVAAGHRARALLGRAAEDPDAEVAFRARECLHRIEQGGSTAVVAAAVRVLARANPPGAAEALLTYLPSADDEAVAEEVRVGLTALAGRDGRPEPALVGALADRTAVKRAAAAVALTRAGMAGRVEGVRKLLADEDPGVRVRVALALASTKDRDAVPVLIDLLAGLPPEETTHAEEFLYNLAGDKAPPPARDATADARRGQRDAWRKWWEAEGSKVDGGRLGEAGRGLGATLVVLLDRNKAVRLDASNRVLWELDNLAFPLDAQMLPGDRVLVAEHRANRVTERDRTNKVLWVREVEEPLVAQRLPDGHTFIATKTQLLEVDAKGKEVFQHTRPGGETIMKAQKLPDGTFACVTSLGVNRYVRLDAKGNELKGKGGFGVNLAYSGGRVDVLPNGNVLIPETNNNRVVEHDPHGKIVWQAATEQPVAAVRLPDGHTLVTSMNPERGAVELDAEGKVRWQYKTDTRVTRAVRR